MTYRIFSHNGTLTLNEVRGMRGGMGLSGLGASAQASVQEPDPTTNTMVTGVWVKKPKPLPSGYVKHDAISKTRMGWVFGVLGTGASYQITAQPTGGPGMYQVTPPQPSANSSDILEREQAAAGAMNELIMDDQPAQTPVPVATEAASMITLAQYKDELRRYRDTLKMITAALMVGNEAPAVPPRPVRPPGLDVSGSAAVRDLEKKIDEYLIIRLPFAQKNSGGAGQDPFARPPGGDYPPPNSPSAFPGDQLSPGAGQPELSFDDFSDLPFATIAVPYYDAAGNLVPAGTPGASWRVPGGTPGIVNSDAVLSAPAASGPAGSGRLDMTGSTGMPVWGWVAIAGAVGVGAYLLLTKKKGR